MTYTINPNAKNVWIRDNEDTMDLSPITDASSVYLENGRTLEQELGEGSMVSNVATVDCAMSRVTEGTYDGAYESCVFKGKSLVNLFDKSKVSPDHTSYTLGSDNTITYVANNGFTDGVKLNHLKPNTKYALFFDVLTVPQEPNIPYRINDDGTNYNINIFGTGQDNPTSGFHSFTTGNDVSDLKFFFYTNLRNVGFKLTLPVIIEYQEGMENWDIPYFDGIGYAKMPILRNVGKNWLYYGETLGTPSITSYSLSNNELTITNDGAKSYQQINFVYKDLLNYKGKTLTLSGYATPNKADLKPCFQVVFQDSSGKTYYYGSTNSANTTKRMSRTFTIPYDISSDYTPRISFIVHNANESGYSGTAVFSEIMLEESPSPTTYENHKTNILTTTRKNLFDMNRPYDVITDSQATVVQSLDKITVSSAESGIYVNANFILDKDFFAGKTVTGSCLYESDEKGVGTVQITYQDGNGEHHYQWIKTPRTFTFPNSFIGDVMLSISANNTGTPQSNTVTVKNIQLELGSTATSYEPYSKVVLRGIGDVQDTYNALTGEYTQRIGEIILDGSDNETWGDYEVKGDNVKFAYCPTLAAQGSYQFVECLCDKWKADSQANETIQEQISLYNHMSNNTPQTEVRITVSPTKLQSVDVTGFRAWLSQNPLTVQYILAEPVTTIVEPSTIPFAYENGHVILESGYEGQSLLPAMEYSTVVNKTGQIQSVTKTIVKQETQITELEKMLIQGIIEMDYNNTLLTLNLEIDEVM